MNIMSKEEFEKKVLKVIKQEYEELNIKINKMTSKDVTTDILEEVLSVCDDKKHMEILIFWYTDEDEPYYNNWVDVEGEGYGFLWIDEDEEKWHDKLKARMLSMIDEKKENLGKLREKVLVIEFDEEICYHFFERESQNRDVVYRFSDNPLDY